MSTPLTVKDLMQKLSQCNPDDHVLFENTEHTYCGYSIARRMVIGHYCYNDDDYEDHEAEDVRLCSDPDEQIPCVFLQQY